MLSIAEANSTLEGQWVTVHPSRDPDDSDSNA